MSIETQLEELIQIEGNIFAAIDGKGVTVPTGSGLKDAAGLIDTIETRSKIPAIPSDVKLYEELTNITDLSNSGDDRINIYFDENNDDNIFGFLGQVNLSYQGFAEVFKNQDSSGTVFWCRISYNYTNSAMIQYSNGASSTTSQIGLSIVNNRICVEIQNGKLINGFTGQIYKNNSGVYSSKTIKTMYLPYNAGASVVTGYLQVNRYYLKDSTGKYLHNFYPAKKNGIPGLYDIMTGNFYNATNYSKWDCTNEIIY